MVQKNIKKPILALLTLALYVLHQDVWLWGSVRPLVLGFIPIELFYHAAFTVAASVLLWCYVRWAWPGHLEGDARPRGASPEKEP